MADLLYTVLIACGFALLARAVLPWFLPAHLFQRKPFTCATCMSFWSILAAELITRLPFLLALAAFGGTAVLLHISGVFHKEITFNA